MLWSRGDQIVGELFGPAILSGQIKKTHLQGFKEKLDNKLSGWKEKLLSQAGKEVLIKAVAQAIPTYTMSVFKLPEYLQMNNNSLVHRVLKARYFPNTNFLHAELGTKPSFAWRSILSAQIVVQLGYRW